MKINASNFANCIGRIAARGRMTADEATQILQQVADRAERMRATGEADPLVAAARDLAGQVRSEAQERTADAILNARVRDAHYEYVTKNGVGDAASRVRSLLYWMPGAERGENVQTMWHSKMSEWGGLLRGKLNVDGLAKVAADPEMMEPIAEEIQNVRAGRAPVRGEADPARQIAQIFSPISDDIRTHLNSQGARIAKADDYVAHTSHDPYLMRRGGRASAGMLEPTISLDEAFQRWWTTIGPRLDEERTFADIGDDPKARMAFARSAYEAMTTGVRKGGGEAPPGFEGGRNIGRKLSEGRVFFFKDAKSWAEYMRVYGKQSNMFELMNDTVNSGARNYAMMRVLGTNPTANLDAVMRRVEEGFRGDVDGVIKYRQSLGSGVTQPSVENVMALLDGSGNIPVNQLYRKIGATTRAFYDTVYLGAVGVTHLTAAPMTFTTEARFYEPSLFRRWSNLVSSLIPERLKGPERAAMLADGGAYADGVSRELFDPYGQGFSIPGMVSDIHSRFMTATGLPYLISHFKAGFREMSMSMLSRMSGEPFDGLEPHIANTLRKYGIGPEEWDLIRSVEKTQLPNGRAYITPFNAKTAAPAAVEALLRARGEIAAGAEAGVVAAKVSGFQQELGDRMMMWLTDGAEHSVVTPGVRERALWTGGTPPGSLQRELLASAIQYKTWPIAAVHQVLGREIWESLSRRDAMAGLGTVIGLSVLGGYMRMSIRDLAYGEQPRVPKNLADATRIGLAALAQGGGLGIFGDFLFGQMNRFGVSNWSSVGGPAATDVADLYGIFNRWVNSIGTDSKHDRWPDLARWGLKHIPFQNLIYLKGAADYLLYYHILEAMSPGWWRRYNQRQLKDQGRTLQGYRPGAGIPYGVPGIYLKNSGGQTFGLLGENK